MLPIAILARYEQRAPPQFERIRRHVAVVAILAHRERRAPHLTGIVAHAWHRELRSSLATNGERHL